MFPLWQARGGGVRAGGPGHAAGVEIHRAFDDDGLRRGDGGAEFFVGEFGGYRLPGPGAMVKRLRAPTVMVLVTVVPFVLGNVMVTSASLAPGFAIRM
jgi:hypothetical protein